MKMADFEFDLSLPKGDTDALQNVLEMRSKKSPMMVEIGSLKGCSASVIGEYVKSLGGHLFCIDPWSEADVLATFRSNMNELKLQDVVHPMVMKSNVASTVFQDNTLDLVFIDGEHYYKSVMEDIALWYPKLKQGGIMCGHDCQKYLHEFGEADQGKIRDFILNVDGAGYATKNHGALDMGIHAGVVMAVHDSFGKKGYKRYKKSRIWYHKVKHG